MPLIDKPVHERKPPRNVNDLKRENLSANDKIALKATAVFGSMWMFWGLCVWSLIPLIPRLGGFTTIVLYVSAGIIQLIALPLLLVGSNLLGKHAEIRADEEYHYTTTMYRDMGHVMKHLEAQDDAIVRNAEMLEQLMRQAGLPVPPQPQGAAAPSHTSR